MGASKQRIRVDKIIVDLGQVAGRRGAVGGILQGWVDKGSGTVSLSAVDVGGIGLTIVFGAVGRFVIDVLRQITVLVAQRVGVFGDGIKIAGLLIDSNVQIPRRGADCCKQKGKEKEKNHDIFGFRVLHIHSSFS